MCLSARAEPSRHCDPNHSRSSVSRSLETHVEGGAPHHRQGELWRIKRFFLKLVMVELMAGAEKQI